MWGLLSVRSLFLTYRLCGSRLLQILLQIGFDHRDMRAVNDLYAVSFVNHARRSGCFQHRVIHCFCIEHTAPESGRTAIHIADIVLSSQSPDDCFTDRIRILRPGAMGLLLFPARVHIRPCIQLCLSILLFSARCPEIEPPDQEPEAEIIQAKI